MRPRLRRFATAAASVVAVGVLALLGAWLVVRGSLPAIDGAGTLQGLENTVRIDRDAAGVPTIAAVSRTDLARALGFVHAQDRYFEMDLLRRAAAGELSALLGPSQLPLDRQLRLHRFRNVARAVVAALEPQQRAVLDAYVAGVNAGLASLRSRPFEYWLLRSEPKLWSAEDSVLCVHAMYLQLQDARGHYQLQRGLLSAMLPDAAWRFLDAGAPEWEAPVDDTRSAEPRMPLATEFDLRHTSPPPARALSHSFSIVNQRQYPGSNNWAVAGTHTANGAALLANDMHLNLRVPNIWYRARMLLSTQPAALDVTGVTLPGTPLTVAGSNGSIAWGFTNSYGEFLQVIRLVAVAGNSAAYMTAAGPRPFQYADEMIEVKGAASERLRIVSTEWGPVIGEDWEGRPYALQWSAHEPRSTNLNLIELERARSVHEALQAAPTFGIPGQNFMAADSEGHIGWTIAGRLPIRPSARLLHESTDPLVGFSGWLDADQQPRVEDPEPGWLWSANARLVGGAAADAIGDDGMDRGARASQIRDDLRRAPQRFTPAMSLAVQLDDRALFLERWRVLLMQLLQRTQAAGDHSHDDARRTLEGWSGHAAPEDAAYRLVSVFRDEVADHAFAMLTTPARRRAPSFEFETPSSFEGPLWRLMEERPMHLLSVEYAGWDAFLLAALSDSETLPRGCRSLSSCTWGTVNAVHIAHPLSGVLTALAPLLDMPSVVVAGGSKDMPRIQGPHFGASERFSVAPGHEAEGYFEMPGAQSGHPLSPFYRTGFDAWVRGSAAPFLPGPSEHRFILTP